METTELINKYKEVFDFLLIRHKHYSTNPGKAFDTVIEFILELHNMIEKSKEDGATITYTIDEETETIKIGYIDNSDNTTEPSSTNTNWVFSNSITVTGIDKFLETNAGKNVHIFNCEKGLYWKQNQFGYVSEKEDAGVFPIEEAINITKDSFPYKEFAFYIIN